MDTASRKLIGIGLYSLAECEALTGVPARTMRRWAIGYRYRYRDEARESEPVWRRDIELIDGRIALSFLDVMEARFIYAFRRHRVSWAAIREAATIACEMFADNHPFTRGQFRTDGKRIFKQIEDGRRVKLFDLNRKSWVFHEIVEPSLYRGIEFENDQIARWYPGAPDKSIVVDPRIAFGRPVTSKDLIPTDVLAATVHACGNSYEAAARWYGVSPAAAKAAVEFERRFAPRHQRTPLAA